MRNINLFLFLLVFSFTSTAIIAQEETDYDPDDIEIEISTPTSEIEYRSADLISVELTMQGDRPMPEKICVRLTNMDDVKDKITFYELPKGQSLPYTFKATVQCPANNEDEPKDIELVFSLFDGETELTSSDVDITIMNEN